MDIVLPHGSLGRPRPILTATVGRWQDDEGDPTPQRLWELGRRLAEQGASHHELALVASELMWQVRGRRLPPRHEITSASEHPPSDAGRFVYYCVLRHASYLFDLSSCRTLATEAHVRWPEDDLITASLAMAEIGVGDPAGHRRLSAVLDRSADLKVRHVALTAYVISSAADAPRRAIELARQMRRHGQADAIVDFREAVARRRLGDLAGASQTIDRALHELATGPYDEPTRAFVNEQLRQERERILDRIDRDGRRDQVRRTPVTAPRGSVRPDRRHPRGPRPRRR